MKPATLLWVIITINLISAVLLIPSALANTECDAGLCNPLGSNTMKLTDLFIRITQLLLGVTSLFGIIMFIYGGLLLLTSSGNPERVKKAKDTITWAVAGIALIILSGTIVKYIFDNFSFS